MRYTIALEADSRGGTVASCIELPGAIAKGADEVEALANVREMIRLILTSRLHEALSKKARLHLIEVEPEGLA